MLCSCFGSCGLWTTIYSMLWTLESGTLRLGCGVCESVVLYVIRWRPNKRVLCSVRPKVVAKLAFNNCCDYFSV